MRRLPLALSIFDSTSKNIICQYNYINCIAIYIFEKFIYGLISRKLSRLGFLREGSRQIWRRVTLYKGDYDLIQ